MGRNWRFASGEKWWYSIFAVAAILAIVIAAGSAAWGVEENPDLTGVIDWGGGTYSNGTDATLDGTPGNKGHIGVLFISSSTNDMQTLRVRDVSVENNNTTVTNSLGSDSNAYGPLGIYGNVGTPGSVGTALTGTQLLTNMTMTGNQTTLVIVDDAGYSSAFGGAGRIANLPNFLFDASAGASVVSGNTLKVEIQTAGEGFGAHVNGGGLAIESEWTANTAIENVVFSNNTARMAATGGETPGGGTAARGGALYFASTNDEQRNVLWAGADNKGMTVRITGADFTGNTAVNDGAGLAAGGAVAAEYAVKASFDTVNFSSNGAVSASGEAQGGAVRLNVSDHLTGPGAGSHQGDIDPFAGTGAYGEFVNSSFSGNAATSTTGSASGGAVWSNKALYVEATTFGTNVASGLNASGGAIHAEGGNVAIIGAGDLSSTKDFEGNSVQASGGVAVGGAVYSAGGVNSIANAWFDANFAGAAGTTDAAGGAVFFGAADNGEGSISGSKFTGNVAGVAGSNTARGGAVHYDGSVSLDIAGVDFGVSGDGNSAVGDTASGGAVYSSGGVGSVSNSSFADNKSDGGAGGFGGAYYLDAGSATFNNSNFSGNAASASAASGQAYGGAIAASSSVGALSIGVSGSGASLFTGNSAAASAGDARGGAVHYDGSVSLDIAGVDFGVSGDGNSAVGDTASGGAVYSSGGVNSVSNSSFADNKSDGGAGGFGGAYYLGAGSATFNNSNFSGNAASASAASGQAYGGAIAASSSVGALSIGVSGSGASLFTGNSAAASGTNGIALGGAIHHGGGSTLDISGVQFGASSAGNMAAGATAAGGAVYSAGGGNTVANSVFLGNFATGASGGGMGGAYYLAGDAASFTDAVFSGNTAAASGAGSAARGGALYYGGVDASVNFTILDGVFGGSATTGNEVSGAVAEGGAVYAAGGGNIVATTEFSHNKADGNQARGGAYHLGSGTASLGGDSFTGNAAVGGDIAQGGAVYANAGARLTIVNSNGTASSFDGNTATGNSAQGGAVYSGSNLTVNIVNSDGVNSFTGNRAGTAAGAVGQGGAIYAAGTAARIAASVFGGDSAGAGNSALGASSAGGAVYSAAATTDVSASEFSGNIAGAASGVTTARGGAIYAEGNAANFSGSVFAGNSALGATASGGAIHSAAATAKVTGGSFADNAAAAADSAQGGAIANLGGNLTVARAAFTDNSAEADQALGGAIYNSGGNLAITSDGTNTFTGNTASGVSLAAGGAVYSDYGDVDIDNETFTGQNATATGGEARGGAVAVANGVLALAGSDFRDNAATAGGANGNAYGGAVYVDSTASANAMSGNTFSGNSARGDVGAYGGAISNAGAVGITLAGSGLTGNTAVGGVYSFGGAVSSVGGYGQTGGSLSGNAAGDASAAAGEAYGGAIAAWNDVSLTDVDLSGNSATGATGLGGAVFMSTNTAAAVTTLAIASSAGNMTVSGNTASGRAEGAGILFKDAAFFFGSEIGDSSADAVFNIDAAAGTTLSLLDATGVDMNKGKSFTFNRNGAGDATLAGTNVYRVTDGGSATLNFNSGNTTLASNYSAAFLGDSDAAVNIADGATLTLALARDDTGQPLFDFRNGNGSDHARAIAIIGGRATIDATIDGNAGSSRLVRSFKGGYVLAAGISEQMAEDLKANIDLGAGMNFATIDDLKVVADGRGTYSLVSDTNFDSPFERSGVNVHNALDALEQLITHDPELVDADGYNAMLANPRALTADLYVEQGDAMMNAADLTANTALDKALRSPHHAALRLGGGYGFSGYGYASVPATRASNRSAYGNGSARGGATYAADYPVGFRVWGGFIGDYARRKSSASHNGYNSERNGFLIGLNYDFGSAGSIGFFGGYTHAETKDRAVDARIRQDAGHFGLMGRVSPVPALPNFSLYGDAGYHFSSNKSSRAYGFNNIRYSSSGNFNQGVFTMGAGADYLILLGDFSLTPFAKIRYSYLDQDSMSESGNAPTNLRVGGMQKHAFVHRLGMEAAYNIDVGSGTVTPAFDIAWKHQWGSRRYDASGYYNRVTAPVAFRTSSRHIPRDSLDLGFSARAAFDVGAGRKAGGEVGVRLNIADRNLAATVHVGGFLAF